jgi:peptidoglycan hydrolase-like protein with peptidoglycan-binding domain
MILTFRNYATGLALALALVQPQGAVLAASEDGLFATRGTGSLTCTDYVSRLQGENGTEVRNELALWLSGYLSHANRSQSGFYDVSPVNSIPALAAIIGRVCVANPDALVETAVNTVLISMSELAPRSETPESVVRNGDLSVAISEDVLLRVQQKFVAQGLLDESAADGKWGPMTREAILVYQGQRSLRQTGIPDPLTLFDLALVVQ